MSLFSVDLPRKRTFGSERKRRLRERQRRGEIVAPCVVNNTDIEWLIDHEYLLVDESEDREEIGIAIMAALRRRKIS